MVNRWDTTEGVNPRVLMKAVLMATEALWVGVELRGRTYFIKVIDGDDSNIGAAIDHLMPSGYDWLQVETTARDKLSVYGLRGAVNLQMSIMKGAAILTHKANMALNGMFNDI